MHPRLYAFYVVCHSCSSILPHHVKIEMTSADVKWPRPDWVKKYVFQAFSTTIIFRFKDKTLSINMTLEFSTPTMILCATAHSDATIENHAFAGFYSFSTLLEEELMFSTSYELQSSDSWDTNSATTGLYTIIQQQMGRHLALLSREDSDWWLKQVENIFVTNHWYWKCETVVDYLTLVQTAYKLFTGKCYTSFLQRRFSAIFGNLQSDATSDLLKTLRSAFDTVESISENPLLQKVTGLYSYLLVQGFLSRFGLELNDEDYSRMEQRALQTQYSSKKGLWMNVLDTTLFMCERFHEWKRTGELSSFLHSGGEYEQWAKDADKLLALSAFTSNLEAHGTTYFTFVSDLNDAVERGEAYARFSKKISGVEVMAIKRKLMSLQLMKNTEITRRSAQKERRAPFGTLVHGTSSVAKSTFSKMLYYYYGSLFGLDTDDHYRYVRSPTDEYWSNFDSSKWCIQMDDIAFLLPSASSEVDPTLKEMLNVVNNVPYVPPQAAIEDKGKTPVMARLVVATTNAKDLNAMDYFFCPLAVRRRLPYVVHVEPKQEFIHANGRFIEPSKLAPIDGAFPDFWNITVQKVVPVFDGVRDQAQLEDVAVYSSTSEFLKDFGLSARHHEMTQDKAMTCDLTMSQLKVCRECLMVSAQCTCGPELRVQAIDVEMDDFEYAEWQLSGIATPFCAAVYAFLWACITVPFSKIYHWIIEVRLMLWLLEWTMRYSMMRSFVFGHIVPRLSDSVQVRLVGRLNGAMTGTYRWRTAIGVMGALIACVTMYFTLRRKEKKPRYQQQGNVMGTTETQLEKEENQNVWYNPTIELTKFDVPVASQSLSTATDDEVRELFARNCVRLKIQTVIDGVTTTRSNGAVFLKGHLCLTNNHAFRKEADVYRVTVVQMSTAQGLSSNLTFTVRENDLTRVPGSDMVLFEVRCLPPFKDIMKFWDHSGGSMFTRAIVLRRLDDGTLEKQNVFNLQHCAAMPVEALGQTMPISVGQCPRQTALGDCGAIAIAQTPKGPVVFGLHIVGYNDRCGSVCVSRDLLEEMIATHEAKFGQYSLVQGGGEPMLDLVDKKNPLVMPHHKSLFRYLPEGSMNLYGSFAGFRPRPRSKVGATPLQEVMLEHFECEVGHGKPVMDGWEPWRKNVVEMVRPTVNYRRDILEHCVQSYTNDILTGLPEGWEGELVFLSRKAAVNGLPGVKFIDRINTNSSMGFPWNESKKRHLCADIDEMYPEGVDFTPEVWERVDKIEEAYARGERAFPVFTGHLKDEPVPHAKIAAKKTRVFTASPNDWSLVVRSRLLSFVRLLQKNKFVFEAGPGTVCQSAEWGDIHEYLTAFGEDRIVAGDYGKFDKRMISDFVLSAFRIIQNVYEAAGFSADEVREIACIGEDTAFPLTNFNGDLVEFFGTNPSGHPLTVIINSLVNSLYMRYCYVILNPEHECVSFQKNVHLFTYGDDNIMGVSPLCSWFGHTGIQLELSLIGVEYTMADKESDSVPFVNISEVQFLKRSWVFNEEVGAFLCPLELASIHKSLTVWLPSGSIDEYAQMVAVISSANSEFFFYGREVFEKHHAFFNQILNEEPYSCYVTTGTLPTWSMLVDRFHQSSENSQGASWRVQRSRPIAELEYPAVQFQ
nr:MAG: hypothetical protein 1 [Marnaviridae sp.]